MRKIHNLVQGTPDWHAYRASQLNASDAPAMLGESSYKSRDQLLKEKATGFSQEIDSSTQRLFDQGHEFEAMARPIAEKIIGEDLFPATVSLEINGLSLSASLDGWTMDEAIIFEHKTMNKTLEAYFDSSEPIPLEYRIQMEQQLMVSGAEKCLFMASKGAKGTEQYVWYFSDPQLRARIIAGWKQFKIDVANYVPTEADAPKPVAEPVAALPSINYQIDFSKGLSIHSNLDVFKIAAQKLVENSKAILVTDQDFENAKARIKQCENAESNIKSLIDRVLGELGDVNTFKSDLESIGGWIKQSRLNQEKQVKTRTSERKAEIINAGKAAVKAHIDAVNAKLVRASLPNIPVDFDAAVFRKSSFESMQSSVNDAVADFKIEAGRWETHILMNLMSIDVIAKDHMFLFPDLQQLLIKDSEAMGAIAKQRIAEHKQKEDERIQAAAKKIADAQIEADRKAKELEQLSKPVHGDNITVGDHKQVVAELSTCIASPAAHGATALAPVNHAFEKAIAGPSVNSGTSISAEKLADYSIKPGITRNVYQQGMIDGLDLALAIFMKHGANGFVKAVEDFIESDCLPEAPKPKVAA